MIQSPNKRLFILACFFLAVATAVAYLPVLKADFINYDDNRYVTKNAHVATCLTTDNFLWAFTSLHFFMWHPITSLSHMLDCQLFGLNPAWHHLTSLLLHIINALLLFKILEEVTGRIWPSAFAAAVFALHPLNVQSVAWVAERKTVLSGLFWMLTIISYIRYAKNPRAANYLLVLFVFSLALMSKPTAVTLPFALLLLNYWPLSRFQWSGPDKDDQLASPESPQADFKKLSIWRLVGEKIPLFILSSILCVITIIAQKQGDILNKHFSFSVRLSNALVSYVAYIGKMIYPAHLAIFYPHPGNTLPLWKVIFSFVILVTISIGALYMGRRKGYLAAGWFWYLGTLIPVIGLIQAGDQAMADRYAYVPLIGLFIIVAWAAADLSAEWRYCKIAMWLLSPAVILVLCVCTWLQTGYWQNSIILFQHAINVTSNNGVAYNNLGVALAEKGQLDKAMADFQTALKIKPDDIDANFNIAETLAKQGKTDEAAVYYDKVLSLRPGEPHTYVSLAAAKIQKGLFEDAIVLCRKGLKYHPQNAQLHSNLGLALIQTGKMDEAAAELETAVKLGGDSMAYNNLALAVLSKGDYRSAVEYYRKSIQLDPKNAQAHYNLANLFLAQKRAADAVAEYKQALRLNPNYAKAYGNLAVALLQQNKFDEAIENFEKVMELDPNNVDVHFNLAAAFLNSGQFDKAADQYRKVLSLDPNDVEARKGLEAAISAQKKAK